MELEKEIPNITFFNCLPNEQHVQELGATKSNCILVCDDFSRESAKSELIESLFVRGCHHLNITLIMLTQQLFYPGASRRTQSINTSYNIFMRNPAGADQVAIFARQRFPCRSKEFIATYDKVMAKKYAHIMVDSHPSSDSSIAIRSGLLPHEPITVYQFNS